LLAENKLTIQRLTTQCAISAGTLNQVLKYNYYPTIQVRRVVVRALSECSGREYIESDVWPEERDQI
jgi:hypothetical protein